MGAGPFGLPSVARSGGGPYLATIAGDDAPWPRFGNPRGGALRTPPGVDRWGWVNSPAGSLLDGSRGGVRLWTPANAADSPAVVDIPVGMAPPWTWRAMVVPLVNPTNYLFGGIGVRYSGDGKLVLNVVQNQSYTVQYYTSGFLFSSQPYAPGVWQPFPYWWQVRDDGTLLHFETSVDGIEFTDQFAPSNTAWLGASPDRLVLAANCQNATYGAGVWMLSSQVVQGSFRGPLPL